MAGRRRSILALCLLTSCIVPASVTIAAEDVTYSYDALGRLVKVSRSGSVNNGVSSCYTYDDAANRSNVTVATAADCSTTSSQPSLSVSDATATEGPNNPALVFLVTRTGAASVTSTVNYATSNGTATSGSDYSAASGALTFAPGQTTKQVSVPVLDNAIHEASETMNLTLSGATGATISDTQGIGTISDNDQAPSFAIGDAASVVEGGNLVLTVTKTGSTSVSLNVNFATGTSGAATSGSDFTATSGTLTFAAGDTSKTITVVTINDTAQESSETVHVNLSNPTGGATITDSQGVGTILDNDVVPTLSISDAYGLEGENLVFTVTKSGGAATNINVDFATANGTAGSSDYYAKSGTLTFAPAELSKTITVTAKTDTFTEGPEYFNVNLSNPTGGATISDAQGRGDIEDNSNSLMAPGGEEPSELQAADPPGGEGG